MKLSQKISVTPPPFSDNSGHVTHPAPITTDELDVTFSINTADKQIISNIDKFPLPITLYSSSSYDELGGFWK